MTYQLVLQLPANSVEDYDELVALENDLIANCKPGDEVDGHDFGQGEANIFVITEQPELAFRTFQQVLAGNPRWKEVRAAFRKLDGSEYTAIWPKGARFRIK